MQLKFSGGYTPRTPTLGEGAPAKGREGTEDEGRGGREERGGGGPGGEWGKELWRTTFECLPPRLVECIRTKLSLQFDPKETSLWTEMDNQIATQN
jgi:hypothetical protein